MPDHPLTAVGGGASLYVQETEPTETPQPAPDGDGGIWYPLTQRITGLDGSPWSYSTGGDALSGVAISNGTAVVGSDDNNVYGINLSDGTEQWSYSTGGRVLSGVAISNGTAVVGSYDNNVYGLLQQTVNKYETPQLSDCTNWVDKL